MIIRRRLFTIGALATIFFAVSQREVAESRKRKRRRRRNTSPY